MSNLHDSPLQPEDEKPNAAPAGFEPKQNISQASSSKEAPRNEATTTTYDVFGIQSNFFQKFQSPDKRKDTTENCTDIVVYQGPESSNKAMDTGTSRPALRRQLAKSSFALDDSDLSTLALALQSKTQESEHAKEEQEGATPSPRKKKTKAKGKAKPKQSAKAKPSPKAMKSTFRHRKTSSAYHSAKTAAKNAGYSPRSQKAKAKAASQKVAAQIDQGILKE